MGILWDAEAFVVPICLELPNQVNVVGLRLLKVNSASRIVV